MVYMRVDSRLEDMKSDGCPCRLVLALTLVSLKFLGLPSFTNSTMYHGKEDSSLDSYNYIYFCPTDNLI
jgi:hypothetical protein